MKADQNFIQIAEQIGLYKTTISREPGCNEGCRDISESAYVAARQVG